MSDQEILNHILLSLADDFEAHRPNSAGIAIQPLPGEWEALRGFFARQFAEGLMLYTGSGQPSWAVKLTPAGYATYQPKVEAMRALGTSKTA
jgi:hypothetical protein